jgi:phosphatidate phosphatase PAH1
MAKIKNKAKYKKSDKNVNISTNEYPDNLQMSLSGGGNNRLGYLTLSNRISENLYSSLLDKLNSSPSLLSYETFINNSGNRSVKLTSNKGILIGFINGKNTIEEVCECLEHGELVFSSTRQIENINEIFSEAIPF